MDPGLRRDDDDKRNSMTTIPFILEEPNRHFRLNLLVDGMHCPSCVAAIETALRKQPAVDEARLNLSTRRLSLGWSGDKSLGTQFIDLINSMGYRAVPFDPETAETQEKREEKTLLRTLAVAGFASGNLMLFSVPMWSADTVEMGAATRNMFQWIQALIAIPAIAYCGMPFYRSAWSALKERRTNMDVPISVAVILATLMSLFETLTHGLHAYFDSGVMLLFFLLIGRYLEARARGRARNAAHDLLKLMTGTATILREDGRPETLPMSDLKEGMTLLVAMGEKISADGEVIEGTSEIDTSLITGETLPRPALTGSDVYAGTVNISAPLKIRITRAGERSLIADIIRLMEVAEQSQAHYVTLADRISGWYTPAVHTLAAVTFIGWMLFGSAPWQVALLYAATVLIITCPCALGLAVPVVQVLASGRLMKRGILLKSGSALERLAVITHAVFDKTGTLTLGQPELLHPESYPPEQLQLAASLAAHSKHPLSQAVTRAWTGPLLPMQAEETPGHGLEAVMDGTRLRLGKHSWCDALLPPPARGRVGVGVSLLRTDVTEHGMEPPPTLPLAGGGTDAAPELWLAVEGQPPIRFTFADRLREDAAKVIANLKQNGIHTLLLSGDRAQAVAEIAAQTGIEQAEHSLTPVEKTERIAALKNSGAQVLMVGDGLNDAPSLASASISMSPTSAIDITQNAADIVFQGKTLRPVINAWRTAIFAQKLVKENFQLAIAYNLIAIPMAVAGMVTPLVAAIAMSSSSLVVIANAMRLNAMKDELP